MKNGYTIEANNNYGRFIRHFTSNKDLTGVYWVDFLHKNNNVIKVCEQTNLEIVGGYASTIEIKGINLPHIEL